MLDEKEKYYLCGSCSLAYMSAKDRWDGEMENEEGWHVNKFGERSCCICSRYIIRGVYFIILAEKPVYYAS